jgi:hypothetical protein
VISDILGKLIPPPEPPPSNATPVNLAAAAMTLDSAMKDRFDRGFAELNNKKFLTSVYSNYGLLEAMGRIHFTEPDATLGVAKASAVRQAYDRSVWADLLPRVYSWKRVPYTDGPSASTLPNFVLFVPASESARWQNQVGLRRLDGSYSHHIWLWVSRHPSRSQDEVNSEAMRELLALQNGKAFEFSGHDFTRNDWFGPGAISAPQWITGNPYRFYAITSNAHIKMDPLYRHAPCCSSFTDAVYSGFWKTYADLDGVAVQEWRLVSADGAEIPADVAKALFGAIPDGGLVPASPNLKPYTGGSYVDFQVPAGGLASRFEVFSQWGGKNFSPRTFKVAASSGDMHVGFNPLNYYWPQFDNSDAHYEITYGSTRAAGAATALKLGGGPRHGPRRV